MDRLKGKVALITGGGGGIGGGTAAVMAAEGARVVVTDIDDDRGRAVVERIKQAGGDAVYLHLDVTQEAEWIAVLGKVVETYGGLDILANIAGVCAIAPIEETSYENWRWQIAVDLDGKFLGCKYALPLLAKSGRGAIINIGSTSGLRGTPGLTAYSASKAGVAVLFSKVLAQECAKAGNGVRVNTILPGGIETPMWAKMLNGGILPDSEKSEALRTAVRNSVLAGAMPKRIGRGEDIGAAAVFLASDEASFVNGADIVVDSGISVV